MAEAGIMLKIAVFVVIGTTIVGLANSNFATFNPSYGSGNGEVGGQTQELESENNEDVNLLTEGGKCVMFGVLFAPDNCETFVNETLGDTTFGKATITIIEGFDQLRQAVTRFFTFDVPGAPVWLRAVFAVPINVTIVYLLIQVAPTT